MGVGTSAVSRRIARLAAILPSTAALRILLAGLALSLLPLTGCFTVMRQALSEVRGAQADVVVISGGAEGAARSYVLRLEPTTTTVGPPIVPTGIVGEYERLARAGFAAATKDQPEGGTVLSVAGDVMYFSRKGLLGTALALTRVRMRQDSQLVADVLLRAESSSFREGDEKALAEASVKALVRYLRGKADDAKRDDSKGADEGETSNGANESDDAPH